MKIGDRVQFTFRPSYARREWLSPKGIITALGDGYVTVKWDTGRIMSHDVDVLILAESFPYHSHRTMAQVIQDEQKPQPA